LIWVVLLPLGMLAADWFNDIIEHRQFVQLGLIPALRDQGQRVPAARGLTQPPARQPGGLPPGGRGEHVEVRHGQD
jgi:hypothetical protein